MAVAGVAWQNGRVTIKFLRAPGLVKCAYPGQCPRRDFGMKPKQTGPRRRRARARRPRGVRGRPVGGSDGALVELPVGVHESNGIAPL